MYFFSYLEPVHCSMSSSNCCFLTCIQISQEADQVVWYSHLFQKLNEKKLQKENFKDLPGLAHYRKGRGTTDQIANICCIIEKAREFQKNICFIDYAKTFGCAG